MNGVDRSPDNKDPKGKGTETFWQLLLNPNAFLTGKLVDKAYRWFSDRRARRKGDVPPSEKEETRRKLEQLRASGLWADKSYLAHLRKNYPEFGKLHDAVFNEQHQGRFKDRLWTDYVTFLYGHSAEYPRQG